jgi:FtsP/CotA-like multicopper oxidase with cupredoxin domain
MSALRSRLSSRPTWRTATLIALLIAAGQFASERPQAQAGPATTAERVAFNDNRAAAGTRSGQTVSVRLDARAGRWYPDGDNQPFTVVNAFAIQGGPLQLPGPMIRVREGDDVRVSVRNSLREPLTLHGLYTRPATEATAAAVTIAPGATRDIAFPAGRAGTYYYWGATVPDATLQTRSKADSQLVAALIVDPRDGPVPDDRVLVLSSWPSGQEPVAFGRIVINGGSWPNTERLSYRVGDTVRLRLVNVGATVHPMHLHGFYFAVNSRGNEMADTIFPSAATPRMVVTERMGIGATFSLTWKPTRPGNWLFHCHDNAHIIPGVRLDGAPAAPPATTAHQHVENHAMEMMAGPVMGITVTGTSTDPDSSTASNRRQLRLVARVDAGGTAAEPAYGYTLHTGTATDAPPTPYLPGPTILLKKNEPVSITVMNQLPEPTAVHWHGIELESYYDGVAGYAGEGKKIAPAIPVGGSFEARFTPPRSGTFIYHTHIDEVRQQQAGLSGALIVLDDPATYDPARDILILVTTPRHNAAADSVLINGSATPSMKEMRVGERYRLRFINVHTFRPSMRMRLLRGTTLLEWRHVAKDGMDLPPDQIVTGASEIQMGNGETYDYEFTPSAAGDIRVDVTNQAGVLLASLPIRVR